jgi:hypothetical protein
MRFDNHVIRYAGFALQAVDVLREELQQQTLLVQKRDERVCNCRSVFPRVQLLRQGVERLGVIAEVGYVEDGLGVGQFEAREVGVETCVFGAEVGYACGCADACAGLGIVSSSRGGGEGTHTITTIFCARPSLMYCARASRERAVSDWGGVDSSTTVDSSLPMLGGKSRSLPILRPSFVSRHGLLEGAC